jgi:hypothetical protein
MNEKLNNSIMQKHWKWIFEKTFTLTNLTLGYGIFPP